MHRGIFVALVLGASVSLSSVTLSSVTEAKTITGVASYYKSGKRTANGERFNPQGLTAAHRSLPFGTRVAVTNLKTGKRPWWCASTTAGPSSRAG